MDGNSEIDEERKRQNPTFHALVNLLSSPQSIVIASAASNHAKSGASDQRSTFKDHLHIHLKFDITIAVKK
jgi:hypothetical protein